MQVEYIQEQTLTYVRKSECYGAEDAILMRIVRIIYIWVLLFG